MAKITLNNNHGLFEVDAEVLERAVYQYGASSLRFVREQTAGAMGFNYGADFSFGVTPVDDCMRIECLIMWVESGNHEFGYRTQD